MALHHGIACQPVKACHHCRVVSWLSPFFGDGRKHYQNKPQIICCTNRWPLSFCHFCTTTPPVLPLGIESQYTYKQYRYYCRSGAGKPIGIPLFSFIAVKTGLGLLPNDLRWKHTLPVQDYWEALALLCLYLLRCWHSVVTMNWLPLRRSLYCWLLCYCCCHCRFLWLNKAITKTALKRNHALLPLQRSGLSSSVCIY